jgi:hypothetical protein
MSEPMRVQVTLGDFRRKTADLPDDTAIFLELEDCYAFHEINALGMRYFPAALDAPPALTLSAGQEFDEEHHLIPRLDVYLDCGDWNVLKP